MLHLALCVAGFAGLVAHDGQAVPSTPATQAAPKPELPEAIDAVDAAITAEELYAHVAALASDEAAGRFTGSPESQISVDYLVAKLDALRPYGLEPAGDVIDAATGERSFLQDVELARVTFAELPTMRVGEVELEPGLGFKPVDGYGFEGELELLKVADAEAAPAEGRASVALYLDMQVADARRLVQERGEAWAESWGAVIERGPRTNGRATRSASRIWWVTAPARPFSVEVRGDGRKAIEAAADGTLINISVGGSVGKAYNIVAKLPATESMEGFVTEAVVLSAHYDHLRSIPVEEGEDGIFNGADDDASGVAAVLEIVEALAVGGGARGRDTIVLLATGEEIGLIGTSYYLDHPVVPLANTAMNLNFEMIGRPDPLAGPAGTLWLTGYRYSNLGPTLAGEELAVVDDPRPQQKFFSRSDNYAFVLKGVVGQSLSSFNLHEDYHTVKDEADRLDYEHMRLGVELGLAATRKVLDAKFQVAWSPDFTLPTR